MEPIIIKTEFSSTPEYCPIDTDGEVVFTIYENEAQAIRTAFGLLKNFPAFFCIEVHTGDPEIVADVDGEIRLGHTVYKVYGTGSVYWYGQGKYDSNEQYGAYLLQINDDLTFTTEDA